MIDGELPAEGAVDLREERRRDVDEIDAAQKDRRREAGRVADHPAADDDRHRIALRAAIEQLRDDVVRRLQRLVRLPFLDRR